jgi:phosphate transport system substrate-binding protein
VTQWQKVGDYKAEITAYQREENSGSQVLMRELVMRDTPLYKPTERFKGTPNLIGYLMSSPYIELTDNNRGIGYSVYYYEQFMLGSVKTRTLAVDDVEPNFENIRRRKYPFVADVMVVTRKGLAADSPAAKLRKWLLSPEGQRVVEQSGYVPLER